MKISVDGKELFSITETQKKVLKNEIEAELLDEDLKRRLFWCIDHEFERSFVLFKKEWDERLAEMGVEAAPVDKDQYINLVFSRKGCDIPETEESANVVSVDDVEHFTVTQNQKRILAHYSSNVKNCSSTVEGWVKLRLKWVINSKYDNCYLRLKKEWEPKLVSGGYGQIPLNKDSFSNLIFQREDYKDRTQREEEIAAKEAAENLK